ncbi:phytanoyl-CoA dioxygenase family protein [Frankia sp. Cppng1_Ct_nod]|uniref:phytanoyl-CoA dioxygenase family protein n=1 Tax=Frankia sp. Cppng1_Ct_nod TaxID=2897162 RepID=UPI001A93F1F3|nr:phytanoyl-CoA dioxygenase family protein [Frankia sp. Cppng1_Ct_nod]
MTSVVDMTIDMTSEAIARLVADFDRDGYVIVRGLFTEHETTELEEALTELQRRVGSGELDRSWAGDDLGADFDDEDGDRLPYVHYVVGVTNLSPVAAAAVDHPVLRGLVGRILGDGFWLYDVDDHGVVYQDARPGPAMTYTRIGWHCDHQSRPTSGIWPGVALTFHLDPTSPANGFLRVLPGSHKGDWDAVPGGFGRISGEVAVYCDRGDVLLHHSDLWHAAARATEDPPGGVRRHMRGSYMGGRPLAPGERLEPFNKNAMR